MTIPVPHQNQQQQQQQCHPAGANTVGSPGSSVVGITATTPLRVAIWGHQFDSPNKHCWAIDHPLQMYIYVDGPVPGFWAWTGMEGAGEVKRRRRRRWEMMERNTNTSKCSRPKSFQWGGQADEPSLLMIARTKDGRTDDHGDDGFNTREGMDGQSELNRTGQESSTEAGWTIEML